MLYTTPVLVTVGLSMSIPLALFGEIIIQGKTSIWVYWLGAILVFSAFIVINYSTTDEVPGLPATNVASAVAEGDYFAPDSMNGESDRRHNPLEY